jgi:hypothetical protein
MMSGSFRPKMASCFWTKPGFAEVPAPVRRKVNAGFPGIIRNRTKFAMRIRKIVMMAFVTFLSTILRIDMLPHPQKGR